MGRDSSSAAINGSLDGIDPSRVRLHVCWGNYEGPHTHDVPLDDIQPLLYEANVGALVVSMANARHAHEHHCFERNPLPDGMVLVAGVIDTTSNYVEHPEVVAERLEIVSRSVGDPRRVIAGTDCGFDTSAGISDVAPSVVWAKLAALRAGADLASEDGCCPEWSGLRPDLSGGLAGARCRRGGDPAGALADARSPVHRSRLRWDPHVVRARRRTAGTKIDVQPLGRQMLAVPILGSPSGQDDGMTTALIVIDVQEEYFGGRLPIQAPPRDESLALIGEAMDAATAAGVPVIVVRHTGQPGSGTFEPESAQWQLRPEVADRPHDALIDKQLPGSFTGTAAAGGARRARRRPHHDRRLHDQRVLRHDGPPGPAHGHGRDDPARRRRRPGDAQPRWHPDRCRRPAARRAPPLALIGVTMSSTADWMQGLRLT